MADDLLARYLQKRSTRHFVALVRACRDDVLNTAYRVLGDRDQAEDVTQEVFLKLLTTRWDPHKIRSGRALLAGQTIRTALTRLRGEARRAERELKSAVTRPEERTGSPLDELLDVRNAVVRLPDGLRTCVELRYLGGLTLVEVAAALELGLTTVKDRLREARDLLKASLAPLATSVLGFLLAEPAGAQLPCITPSQSLVQALDRLARQGPTGFFPAAGNPCSMGSMNAPPRSPRAGSSLAAFLCGVVVLLAFTARGDDGETKAAAKKKESGAKPEEGKEAPEAEEDGEKPPRSVEEEYVRENLEAHLHPTSLQFYGDGLTVMEFDFTEKSAEHEGIFTSRIKRGTDGTLRWTVARDERWKRMIDVPDKPEVVGLRVANSGIIFLNCWFTGDVSARVEYAQAVTFARGQTLAVVFGRDKADLVGSNCGTQCTASRKGKPAPPVGAPQPLVYQTPTELGLVVKEGRFEAHRSNRLVQKSTYARKDLEPGRVGILWGGGVAGVINRLYVTGRIDAKKMAEELRKAPRGEGE